MHDFFYMKQHFHFVPEWVSDESDVGMFGYCTVADQVRQVFHDVNVMGSNPAGASVLLPGAKQFVRLQLSDDNHFGTVIVGCHNGYDNL